MEGKQGIFRVIDGVIRYIEVNKSKKAKERYEVSKTYPTKCPGCGKDVYYYENDNGSQVFFNALGDPWPKHDCRRNAKQSSAKANRTRKKKSSSSGVKQSKSDSAARESSLKDGNTKSESSQGHSSEPASAVVASKVQYPAFSLLSLELAFLIRVSHGPSAYALFSRSGLTVDNLKRNSVAVLRGRYVSLDSSQISRLRDGYCNLPIYLANQSKDSATLKTHLLVDGSIQAYVFTVRLGEDIEKPLDDVIWGRRFNRVQGPG